MKPPVSTRAALIQALHLQGPGWGLDLIERISKLAKGKLVLHQGGVYPALQALEEAGLIECFEGMRPSARGGRPRRGYWLTKKGEKLALKNLTVVQALFK